MAKLAERIAEDVTRIGTCVQELPQQYCIAATGRAHFVLIDIRVKLGDGRRFWQHRAADLWRFDGPDSFAEAVYLRSPSRNYCFSRQMKFQDRLAKIAVLVLSKYSPYLSDATL